MFYSTLHYVAEDIWLILFPSVSYVIYSIPIRNPASSFRLLTAIFNTGINFEESRNESKCLKKNSVYKNYLTKSI